ncbi:MAG: retroviral-like aspartic protease family protein [Telluria sp.]
MVSPSGAYVSVTGSINREPASLMVDTGSQVSLLTPAGVDRHHLVRRSTDAAVEGVGGVSRVYRSTVGKLIIGPFDAGRMILPVVADMAPGMDYDMIVGSDLWMQADLEINVQEKWLRFFKPVGCGPTAFVGYWDPQARTATLENPSGDMRPRLKVRINGRELEAIIDSGSPVTTIFRRAAERLGLQPAGAALPDRGEAGGIGANRFHDYEAQVTLQIGADIAPHTTIEVADTDGQTRDYEVLLGMDWLRAHRVLIANSQHRLYFTAAAAPAAPAAQASAK